MKSRRNWVWFFIKLVPFLYLICVLLTYVFAYQQSGILFDVSNLRDSIYLACNTFSFRPVYSALINVFVTVTNINLTNNASYSLINFVLHYISYLVFVEIFRIMYEVIVFLPKFANSFFERKLGD